MNSLSCRDFCCLFCCPPCPSSIAAKLAFLPPEPTYTITTATTSSLTDGNSNTYNLHLNDRAEFQYGQKELDCIEVAKAKTRAGHQIAMMYVKCASDARYTILFSHGNAVDMGQMSSFFIGLGSRLHCNIFTYDYSGYGVSEGRPTERNIYYDIDTAYQTLRNKYGVAPDRIILYGQSIGTVPTVDLASRCDIPTAGVVLHSPLLSGIRVACPNTRCTCCCDPFPSVNKVEKIRSPVMVIHGTDDEVIDFSHGLEIYDRTPITVEPLWVEGAGHNDVELYGQYLHRLKYFLDHDLPNSLIVVNPTRATTNGSSCSTTTTTTTTTTTSHIVTASADHMKAGPG